MTSPEDSGHEHVYIVPFIPDKATTDEELAKEWAEDCAGVSKFKVSDLIHAIEHDDPQSMFEVREGPVEP